ncbi:FkbM family methyltransferase [Nitrosopumilus sp.]|nr:FkbM family methyltransferase [Nitrosopumilus sp.]
MILIKIIFKLKNWTCPIFHYFNLKNNECVAEFRNGIKCIIRNRSDTVVFLENFFLDSYDRVEGFMIKENDTVIDIGAHIGYFTIYAAKKAKKGKVISFEPSKESFKVLKNNLKINNIQNVNIENIGVRNETGNSILYVDRDNEIGNSMFSNDKNLIKENVQVTSITEIIKKYNIKSIDLLKLDCEGAEYEIILKLPINILNKIKRISMEVHKIDNFDIKDIEKFLLENNFQVKTEYLLGQSDTSWPMLYAKNQN